MHAKAAWLTKSFRTIGKKTSAILLDSIASLLDVSSSEEP
jgi:hypothetical protein